MVVVWTKRKPAISNTLSVGERPRIPRIKEE